MSNTATARNRTTGPGIRVTRRTVLQGAAVAAIGALFGRAARAGDDAPVPDAQAFYDAWRALGAQLKSKSSDEERYIWELQGLLARLGTAAMPRRQRVVFDQDGLKTGPAWFEGRIFVIELSMDPGAVIRPHNHPMHNVVTVGLAGACRYEHYEPVGKVPPQEPGTPHFTVRRTRSGVLLPGRRSELTRVRDNIHTFRAGDQGATILDFTTTVGDETKHFSELDIDARPRDALAAQFEARWLGNPYR